MAPFSSHRVLQAQVLQQRVLVQRHSQHHPETLSLAALPPSSSLLQLWQRRKGLESVRKADET
jgi:hypothetical protein